MPGPAPMSRAREKPRERIGATAWTARRGAAREASRVDVATMVGMVGGPGWPWPGCKCPSLARPLASVGQISSGSTPVHQPVHFKIGPADPPQHLVPGPGLRSAMPNPPHTRRRARDSLPRHVKSFADRAMPSCARRCARDECLRSDKRLLQIGFI